MPSMSFSIKGAVGNEDTPGGNRYEGPIPAKGSYKGKLRVVKVGTIGSGKNEGKPRLQVLAEITGPKNAKNVKGGSCIGAGVWGGLNVTEQGVPFVNQFLNALTNGTEAEKKAIQKAFWEKPIQVDDDDHVQKIGRKVIASPKGELDVAFTVRHNPYNGEIQAQIGRWLTPTPPEDEDEDTDDADDANDADDDADADAEDDDPDLEVADDDDDDDDDDAPY